jgi:DNA-directed RNA polymerase sigma subunit (sigma70/sigma32)
MATARDMAFAKAMKINKDHIKERENQATYLRMEGRTYQAVGDIMGVTRERIRQMLRHYQLSCRREGQVHAPRDYEIKDLLPHLDSIKAIYESE